MAEVIQNNENSTEELNLIALSEDVKNIEDKSENESYDHKKTFTISSYGADYTVDLLVKRIENKDFYVPPFQRSFVWNMKQSSKFIESLLLGLPVPGIFVFKQSESNRHLIIDGQQRLKSLLYFYIGRFHDTDRVFKLIDVQDQWEGRTYNTLDDADRRRLDDSILHTTIFKQESPEDDNTSVYEVFERINTGGAKLSPQEIRVCVNFGPVTAFLGELNGYQNWRDIYGPVSPRMKDEEIILRFFAFYEKLNAYSRPLKGFLNDYMKQNKKAEKKEYLEKLFKKTIDVVVRNLGSKPFRPDRALNVAVFDAVVVELARKIMSGNVDESTIKPAYDELLANKRFQELYTGATADEGNVRERFNLAKEAFKNI